MGGQRPADRPEGADLIRRQVGARLLLDAVGWTMRRSGSGVLSAPLSGLVLATFTAPVPSPDGDARPLAMVDPARGSVLGTVGSLGTFLAIGCPVCNKVALVLLGASGALSVWAPIQPFVGAASLALLAVTLTWRLRIRGRGGSCVSPRPPVRG